MTTWQHEAVDSYTRRLDQISADIKAFEAYLGHVHLTEFVDTPAGRMGWALAEPDRFRVVLAWDGTTKPLLECKVEQRLGAYPHLHQLLSAVAARIPKEVPTTNT
jgi:hypothetical protein